VGPWALSLSCIPGISSSKTTFICTACPGGRPVRQEQTLDSVQDTYLFNQEALSLVFRGKFIDHLWRSAQRGNLNLEEAAPSLKPSSTSTSGSSVYGTHPNPQHVLEYLARYTHRVAIANSRLLALKDGMVSFKYKTGRTISSSKPTSARWSLSVAFSSTPASGFRQNPPLWLSG